MASQSNTDKLRSIIGDLRVLYDKCNRDIDRTYPFNYEYYLGELNRIIAQGKQIQHEAFKDVALIQDTRSKSIVSGSMTAEEDAKLREVSAVADKLLSRLSQFVEERIEPVVILEKLFNRFHHVARQLKNRYDSRATIDVNDEYDVQDLIHALLKVYFDDIRPEEWTPSYAGSSSRMDFLLKHEQIVVEVKNTRDALRDKLIGEQLIVDITKYKEHPDCKTLVCFVYDAERLIANPTGLENDLSKLSTDRLSVKVYIFPK